MARISDYRKTICCLFLLCWSTLANAADLAIHNGRVMDPETGLDAIRHISISDGKITEISRRKRKATRTIDAKGLVVAPGFIDLHAHGQDPHSNEFQVADGVTTALELEIGVFPLNPWYASREGKAPINYGATVSHLAARLAVLSGQRIGNPVYAGNIAGGAGADYANTKLSAEQLQQLQNYLAEGLDDGALGIGIGLAYVPGASAEEIYRVFELSAQHKGIVFIHLRQGRSTSGDLLLPVQEALANAAASSSALHIVHLNSSTDELAPAALDMIRGAVGNGIDVTTESYPYTAGSTRLESALFDDYQGDYNDLQWVATGERLTQESFERYRAEGGWIIIHGRSERTNAYLVAQPDVMVASDGIPFMDGFSHPRSAGTFARVLGHYAREEKALSLMDALRSMTLLPAKRLQSLAPDMARKGRVQTGADADLTLFDPDRVSDRATYLQPAQASVGIEYVIVNGVPVIDAGKLQPGVLPGRAIRGPTADPQARHPKRPL
ncbi:MAG: amidohydrolase family protein [Pseudomonadales bacterium]